MSYAGEAKIENNEIVFRVAISYLPAIAGGMEDGGVINDADIFAEELVLELNHEDEVGLNAIQRMLEQCISEAINQGAQGVDIDD
jgi:hypothetical protein